MIEKVIYFNPASSTAARDRGAGGGWGGGSYTVYIKFQSGAPTIWRVGKKQFVRYGKSYESSG